MLSVETTIMQKHIWTTTVTGNTVCIEITCRDNYDAIELSEVIALGIFEGHVQLEFEADFTI